MGRPRGKAGKLEDRRQQAMDLVETDGLTAAETARRLKIHDRTVRKWLAAYRKSGTKGLAVKVSTGRPKKLELRDLKKLQKIILRGPVRAGFPNELWTSKRVLQVIKREFDVDYHPNHLPKLLRALGFTPQRPQREAAEKDQKQIKNWIRYEWTRIKKKARRKKATIVFIDESGILMSPVVKRTWAPAGKTPKISHKTRSHKKISAIGAVTVRFTGKRPRLMFRLLEGKNANSQVFIQFLNQLLQNIRGHIIVVWDRLVAHRSKVVNRWLGNHRRIETEFFPPYAPELNPVEYLWSHLKMNGLANFAAQDLDQLYTEAKGSLCEIRKNKNLLDAFIAHSPANFFGL